MPLATSASRTARATARRAGRLDIIIVDEFDDGELRPIPRTLSKLDDAGVPTRPIADTLSNLFEELSHHLLVLEVAENLSAIVLSVLFRPRNQGLHKRTKRLRLRDGRGDLLIFNERIR